MYSQNFFVLAFAADFPQNQVQKNSESTLMSAGGFP